MLIARLFPVLILLSRKWLEEENVMVHLLDTFLFFQASMGYLECFISWYIVANPIYRTHRIGLALIR